jgi:hypothetical protein
MGDLVLSGATSGTTTLTPTAVSGTTTLTLPATTGTVALTASPTFTGQATIPTINLTGGQITFPATQSASANANTLDDYEEGTWTPAIDFNGANVGVTYVTQFGRYTKIGNLINVSGYVTLSNKGSSTGALRIINLPFISEGSASNYVSVSLWANSMSGITGGLQGYVNPSSTVINYEQTNGGASSSVTNTNCANSSSMLFSAVYQSA